MDPQIEEYRRKQRLRAAAEMNSAAAVSRGIKPSWILAGAAIALVAAVAIMRDGRGSPPVGTCPKPVGIGICVEECSSHDDCRAQGKLCCSNGCGHVCMAPETPGLSTHEENDRKCTLVVTLAAQDAVNASLQAIPVPSKYNHLKAVGILILEYAIGRSSDCCVAEAALLKLPDVATSVEYDGAKPGCASEASDHMPSIADSVNEAKKPLVGAYGPSAEVNEKSLEVWQQVLKKNPVHQNHDLRTLGTPVSVNTQVVAGTNYRFTFRNGAVVTVFEQPWTDTLKVSKVEVPE